METLLFNQVSSDFIYYIKDDKEQSLDEIENLTNLLLKKSYDKVFEKFTRTFYSIYKHEEDFYNTFGSVNIFVYLYNFNNNFYDYLSERLKKDKNKICLEYYKILIKLKASYPGVDFGKIINTLSDSKNKKIKIKYKDRANVISERVINDIKFNIDSYHVGGSVVDAFCLLRNDRRQFLLASILSAKKHN